MAGWNNLPMEVQETIVQNSTQSSRNALKLCSMSSKQLVEWTKLNSIARLAITFPCYKTCAWMIEVTKHEYASSLNDTHKHIFENFEKLQKALLSILESIDCVRELSVIDSVSKKPLNLLRIGGARKKLLVESLVMNSIKKTHTTHLLSQIESIYLKKVFLYSDDGSPEIYDMPQIQFAEELRVFEYSGIREDQLLKLSARKIDLKKIKFSLVRYVEKCIRKADQKFPEFIFRGLNSYRNLRRLFSWFSNKVLLKTPNPQLQLELSFNWAFRTVTGSIRFNSERTASILSWHNCDQSIPRMLEELSVIFDSKDYSWSIYVTRRTHSEYEYKYKSIGKFEEKLNEILECTDYVKSFYLHLKESDETITWKPRNKQLQVSLLDLKSQCSMETVHNLMKIVDFSHIKKIDITTNGEESPIFEMPHFFNASSLQIRNSIIREEHILKMNAEHFRIESVVRDGVRQDFITESFINHYIKKCLHTLSYKAHDFCFHAVPEHTAESEILEDLNIICMKEGYLVEKFWIDSVHSEFVMEVKIDYEKGDVFGVRRRRSELIF